MSEKKKTSAVKEPMTKSQIVNEISESTGHSKKDVNVILEELAHLIERHIKPRGAGQFVLPGLFKILVAKKPATKERKGVNPFTGEEMVIKAKPARKTVKVRPLKKLKDMVG